jgi:hypothetical protein
MLAPLLVVPQGTRDGYQPYQQPYQPYHETDDRQHVHSCRVPDQGAGERCDATVLLSLRVRT